MLSIVLSVFVPRMTVADKVCFDLEAGQKDWPWTESDEVEEDTTCTICAWQYGPNNSYKFVHRCKTGMQNDGSDYRIGENACIDFEDGELVPNEAVHVSTNCDDAMWIDRVQVTGQDEPFDDEWNFLVGAGDMDGFCLSSDRNDHLDWNHDNVNQYVSAGQCFYELKFEPNGSAWGSYDIYTPLLCRSTGKMDCKQECPSGWYNYKTTDHGCCAGWGDCGGNRKHCRIDQPCRRRAEEILFDDETGVEVQVKALPRDDKKWVELTTSRAGQTNTRLQADTTMKAPAKAPAKVLSPKEEGGQWVKLQSAHSEPTTSGQADSSSDDELMSFAELMEQLKESEDTSDLEIEIEEVSTDGDRRRWGAQNACWATYKATCKRMCESGWEHYGYSDLGCCANFWSCGGHRKLCRHQIVCPYEYSAGGETKQITNQREEGK